MKTFLLALMLPLSGSVFSQSQPDSLYVVTYTTGSAWDVNKPPQDQPYFKEHSANLGKLRQGGTIKMGARYGEKGMIVIKAASLIAAKEIINADLAVANKLFTAEVQKFNVFYDGCVEKPVKK